jgi:hypothetical protein
MPVKVCKPSKLVNAGEHELHRSFGVAIPVADF